MAMTYVYPRLLPEPDEWGSYYLGDGKDRPSQATILPSRHPKRKGKYHASDVSGTPLTDGYGLRWFDSAEEALRFLRAQVGEV